MQINNLLAQLNALNQDKIQGKEQNRPSSVSQEPAQDQDKVQLSSQGQVLSQVQKGAEEGPEVREEKVQALKQLVQNGEYKPDSEKTAQALVEQELEIGLF
ncbi:MAG: flagellar biosynthesis anti-sigma factor FlgM [Desulfohalobiaceae bacterium]